jgi:hypothetical protein
MRVTIWLTPTQLSILQDEARLAHRIPKDHLEWLIGQALEPPADPYATLQARVAQLEQQVSRAACAEQKQ